MLKNSKLVSETAENYHIQLPSGHKMSLDKKGLHENAHKIVKGMQKFEDGGTVQPNSSSEINPNGIDNNFGAGTMQTQDQQMAAQAPMAGSEIQPKTEGPALPPAVVQDASVNPKISNANKAFEAEQTGLANEANIIGQQGAAEQGAINQTAQAVAKIPTQQEVFNKYQAADQQYQQALESKTIDPDHYWKNKDTGSKIAAGLGMLLGGLGAGAGQGNVAVNMIEKSIDRDIEAQKSDQSKAMNLWKMNREKMGNDMAADLATQNQLYTALKFKLEGAASQFKGPMAKEKAAQGIALIEQKKNDNNFKLSLMNSGDGDPASKIQFLVPPEQVKSVGEEVKRAQDTKSLAPEILKRFDEASQDIRPLSGGRFKNLNPWSQSAPLQTLQGLLGATITDLTGTARQAEFDNIKKNFSPWTGASDADVKTTREGLIKYLGLKSSAPIAKTYGIDLDKYGSTSTVKPEPEKPLEMLDKKTGKIWLYDAKTKAPLGAK